MSTRHHTRRAPRGVSLIEIIVYITIISMLMAAVTVYAIGIHRDSQRQTALLDVKNAAQALELYRGTTGHYPEPADGFAPLLKRRILKAPPVDPWGTPLTWKLSPDGEPIVVSLGADKSPGGVDDGEDVTSAQATTE